MKPTIETLFRFSDYKEIQDAMIAHYMEEKPEQKGYAIDEWMKGYNYDFVQQLTDKEYREWSHFKDNIEKDLVDLNRRYSKIVSDRITKDAQFKTIREYCKDNLDRVVGKDGLMNITIMDKIMDLDPSVIQLIVFALEAANSK